MNPESSWWGNLIQNFPWILVPDSSLRESLPKDSQRAGGVVWGLANSGTWETMPEGRFVHAEREGAKWTGGMPHDVKKGRWRHSCWQWEHREVKVPFWQSQLFSLSPPCLSSQASAAKFPAHRQGSGRGFFLPARAPLWAGLLPPDPEIRVFPCKMMQQGRKPRCQQLWHHGTGKPWVVNSESSVGEGISRFPSCCDLLGNSGLFYKRGFSPLFFSE